MPLYTAGIQPSTFYFMNQILGEAVTRADVNQLLFILIEVALLACLVPLFFILAAHAAKASAIRKIEAFKGKRCTHCGEPLPKSPTRAVAVGAKNFYVYSCRRCNEETALTTPPTSE